jgi:cell division transport system permease protein
MLGSHIKTSLQYVRRSPFQALAAISVLAVTFFVGTLISLLLYGSNQVLHEFETRPQVIAFMEKDSTTTELEALQQKLQGDARVRDVKIVSKEEAAEIYKSATEDNPLLGELVSPSIFPTSIEFSARDLEFAEDLINDVKDEGGVESVGFTASLEGESSLGEVLERLRTATRYIRIGGVASVIVLGVTSLLVLMVIIGMRIQSRKTEIETLSLIGATRGFIRVPILFEAIIYALWGAFIGWLLAVIGVLYASPALLNFFGSIAVIPHDTSTFFLLLFTILCVELFLAWMIAVSASWITISRALK